MPLSAGSRLGPYEILAPGQDADALPRGVLIRWQCQHRGLSMIRVCCVIALVLAPELPPAAAQEVTGVITGQVKDHSGAAIPGAEVTALHTPTGSVRKALADESGSYVFTSLPIGPY